ncbi:MAG: TolC family protein [Muribaculaceae bacterium]|nr:TolC family protein [Muribaculaceae bacterium]
MKKYIIIIVTLISAASMNAQETLSLEQCRELALKNNVSIRNSVLQLGVAKEVRKEAFTKYFPNISAAGFAFTTNHSVLKYNYDSELPIPPIPGILPEGAAFPINLDLSLIKKGVMAGANLVQPVFMGGMIVNGNKLAEVGEAVAELQSRQSADQVRVTVEQYYWQLASLKAKRHTVDEVITMLDSLERQADVGVKAGVLLRNDLLEVQLKKNEMLTAQIELDNGISILSTILGQYIGLGLNPINIEDIINTCSTVEKPDGKFLAPADALSMTSDYQLLQQSVKASDLKRKITIGENMPKIGVGAGYFYHNMMDQGHGFGAVFATVVIPISGWWGGSHSIKQSKLNTEIARNELIDCSELLQVKIRNSWNQLTTAYEKIGVAHNSIEQSKENLRLNENYYNAGTITITDLLKAQTLYRKSCDQFVDAFGDYQVKTIEYMVVTGR